MRSVGVRIGCLAVAFQGEFLLALKQSLSRFALAAFAELPWSTLGRSSLWIWQNIWDILCDLDTRPAMAMCPVASGRRYISSQSSTR
ncbi:hypothetical protein Pr1d_06350 [Bythopirellula goksoeyrii]|uniref:Uncharacterized protein n=1 Tax=Bythopirellula goksoeyrii TaxID=1400387 RepID=A0A5B9Q300_9BACT|nr:hypothetical protein Pr1d_06350 [Bythopirellula goksoeyrii]